MLYNYLPLRGFKEKGEGRCQSRPGNGHPERPFCVLVPISLLFQRQCDVRKINVYLTLKTTSKCCSHIRYIVEEVERVQKVYKTISYYFWHLSALVQIVRSERRNCSIIASVFSNRESPVTRFVLGCHCLYAVVCKQAYCTINTVMYNIVIICVNI